MLISGSFFMASSPSVGQCEFTKAPAHPPHCSIMAGKPPDPINFRLRCPPSVTALPHCHCEPRAYEGTGLKFGGQQVDSKCENVGSNFALI